MGIISRSFAATLLLIAASLNIPAQQSKPPANTKMEEGRIANQQTQNQQDLRKQELLKQNRTAAQAREDLNRTGISTARVLKSDKDSENLLKERNRQFKRTKDLLVPSKSFYEKYRDYLKSNKFELARLQIDNDCGNKLVLSVKDAEKCANSVPVQGSGSYYSFINKVNYLSIYDWWRLNYNQTVQMYESDKRMPILQYYSSNNLDITNNWWNIHLNKNHFEVGKNLVQGVISNIGERDLNEVTLNSPEVKILLDYQPGKNLSETAFQNSGLKKGIKVNNLIYSTLVPVELEKTYILRSILYPFKPDRLDSEQKNYTSKGMEITVTFKVAGREDDGSIVILWKELEKKKLEQKYKM